MIRYFIKELTDEGRLITPMWRGQYDYTDSPMFDNYSGYASLEAAEDTIHIFEVRNKVTVYDRLVILPIWKAK